MKKLFTGLMLLAAGATASAQNFTFTATPEQGVVPELTSVVLVFPEWAEIEVNSSDDITATLDGEPVSLKPTKSSYTNEVTVNFAETQVTPGAYTITIAAGAIMGYNEDYSVMKDLEEPIVLNYTIEGSTPDNPDTPDTPDEPGTDAFAFTVNPEQGVVPELRSVALVFPGWADIDINSANDITAARDGEPVALTRTNDPDSNELIINFEEPQVAAGNYTITIAAGAIGGFNEDYSVFADLEKPIVLSYTIEGSQETNIFDFTVDPAEGTVEELSKVALTFPNAIEIDFATADDNYVTLNGEKIEGVKSSYKFSSNVATFTFENATKASGTYEFVIPAGNLTAYGNLSDEGEYQTIENNPADIKVVYTIESGAVVDFAYTAAPANGETVNGFTDAAITFGSLESVEVTDKEKISVSVNGSALALPEYTATTEGNVLTVGIVSPIEEGKVEIAIAEGALNGSVNGMTEANSDAISLAYTVAAPVQYDLTLELSSPTKPNAEGQISAERSIESFFFAATVKNLNVNSANEAYNVTIKEVNGDFEREGKLRKAFGLNQNYTYFSVSFGTEPKYNGEYVITIEKGAFGDAIWVENPELGHSNETIELVFTLVDGLERVNYNVAPVSVAPAEGKYAAGEDFATVTLTFAEGIELVKGMETVWMVGKGALTYQESAQLVKNEDGSFSASFAAPTENGEYLFSVLAGAFGDAEFVASEGKSGNGSVSIELNYELDTTSGVGTIGADEAANGVYNLQGIRVADTLEGLPAGLYIVNGKKVAVSK